MALHIRDAETDRMVRKLAAARNISLTDAIKVAVGNELDRPSPREKIKAIQDRLARMGNSGLVADKAFYDSLNDE